MLAARLLAIGLLASGCAGGRGLALPDARTSAPTAESLDIPAAELGTQRIYRVRYQGSGGGGGGLRLVLRLAAAADFRLAASDTLGRPVWSLAASGERTLIVDHRRRQVCATGRAVRVPEAALASLPIEMLPVVLLGRLPVPGFRPGESDEELDLRDDLGRRWTARMEQGSPVSWTLWRGDEPSLWWLAQPRGGILSHRSGSQFRWRESVVEPLAAELEPLEPPEGYDRVECDDWSLPELREDQPSPPGDRPAD